MSGRKHQNQKSPVSDQILLNDRSGNIDIYKLFWYEPMD